MIQSGFRHLWLATFLPSKSVTTAQGACIEDLKPLWKEFLEPSPRRLRGNTSLDHDLDDFPADLRSLEMRAAKASNTKGVVALQKLPANAPQVLDHELYHKIREPRSSISFWWIAVVISNICSEFSGFIPLGEDLPIVKTKKKDTLVKPKTSKFWIFGIQDSLILKTKKKEIDSKGLVIQRIWASISLSTFACAGHSNCFFQFLLQR